MKSKKYSERNPEKYAELVNAVTNAVNEDRKMWNPDNIEHPKPIGYMALKRLQMQADQENTTVDALLSKIKSAGFDTAVAIATNEEVKANAACGQMASIIDTIK